jgi:hypothetical protein
MSKYDDPLMMRRSLKKEICHSRQTIQTLYISTRISIWKAFFFDFLNINAWLLAQAPPEHSF